MNKAEKRPSAAPNATCYGSASQVAVKAEGEMDGIMIITLTKLGNLLPDGTIDQGYSGHPDLPLSLSGPTWPEHHGRDMTIEEAIRHCQSRSEHEVWEFTTPDGKTYSAGGVELK